MKLPQLLYFFLTVSFLLSNALHAQNHPFLIVTEDMYPALRAKASAKPFSTIKFRAEVKWDETFSKGDWEAFAEITGANALRYILETDDALKEQLRTQFIQTTNRWPEHIPLLGTGGHDNTVDAASALFNSILALDVMYNDFTPQELSELEATVDEAAQFYINDQLTNGDSIYWRLAPLGVVALYAIFKGDADEIVAAVENYRHFLLEVSMTGDGTWTQSPGYWHARLGGNRLAKTNAIDVIQFTGHYDFYNDPKLVACMDWGNAFGLAPSGQYPRFGETGSIKKYTDRSTLLYRMSHFSEKAGRNAAWHLNDDIDHPDPRHADFLTYVLTPTTQATPEMPSSILLQNGGAAFWDRTDSREALMGILYNLEVENLEEDGFGHASEDMNSIGIYGYGEMLMANAGTNYKPSYPGETPDGGRWIEAWMQNVVLVDGETRHASKHARGLEDKYGLTDTNDNTIGHGLAGGNVEFAEGLADLTTLGNASHFRTLFFVHPVAGRSYGYFAIKDQVQSAPNKDVSMLLQLNTRVGGINTVQDNKEYTGTINGFVTSAADGDEKVTVFYGTPPDQVNNKQAWKGAFDESDFKNEYLEAVYNSGIDGWTRYATVIFPEDSDHPKVPFAQIAGAGFSGAEIDHGQDFIDHFFESDGTDVYTHKAFHFNGETIFYRTDMGDLAGYAVAYGNTFKKETGVPHGFSSTEMISIQMDYDKGYIMSAGAEVTFFRPNITDVILDGNNLSVLSSTANSITVNIPAGKYEVELLYKVDLTGISVYPPKVCMQVGETAQLLTEIVPEDASDQSITWSSGDPDIASVDTNGLVTANNYGTTYITITTEDGGFTDSSRIAVPEKDTANLAYNQSVTFSGQDTPTPAVNAVDGIIDATGTDILDHCTRWSVEFFPQWIQVDLGENKVIDKTEIVPLNRRAYQYYIEVSENGEDYIEIVDRRNNNEGPANHGEPIIDTFNEISARYVKLTVTGIYDSSTTWISILEFRVFGRVDTSVGVNELVIEGLSIYPNPFNQQLTIEWDNPVKGLEIVVSDTSGKIIKSIKCGKRETRVTLSGAPLKMPEGLYFLTFKAEEKRRTINIIKSNN